MFIRRPYDIGVLVRTARQARGLNQQDLADRLGVSRWWVNEFERGKPTARLDFVLRALAELQITLTASTESEGEEPVGFPAVSRG
ncbi:MAG: helix-turn-helix domain-containing protein [Alphaproteobacteria bacterium]